MTQHYDIDWLTQRFENGETIKYFFFWGHTNKYNEEVGKFCLSQWFECPFIVDNITYYTAEHWMMAQKALLFRDINNFEKIIQCEKPGEAKEFGRQVVGYDDQTWNAKKFEIVKLGNIHKFNQHPKFADYLLKTDDRILVEASPVDTIWGIGLSQDSKDIKNIHAWRGQNMLGFALMATRDFLKEFGHFSNLESSIQPPWTKFPSFHQNDRFWIIGKGDAYLTEFVTYYKKLTDREKIIYQLTNPTPFQWNNFYD